MPIGGSQNHLCHLVTVFFFFFLCWQLMGIKGNEDYRMHGDPRRKNYCWWGQNWWTRSSEWWMAFLVQPSMIGYCIGGKKICNLKPGIQIGRTCRMSESAIIISHFDVRDWGSVLITNYQTINKFQSRFCQPSKWCVVNLWYCFFEFTHQASRVLFSL